MFFFLKKKKNIQVQKDIFWAEQRIWKKMQMITRAGLLSFPSFLPSPYLCIPHSSLPECPVRGNPCTLSSSVMAGLVCFLLCYRPWHIWEGRFKISHVTLPLSHRAWTAAPYSFENQGQTEGKKKSMKLLYRNYHLKLDGNYSDLLDSSGMYLGNRNVTVNFFFL